MNTEATVANQAVGRIYESYTRPPYPVTACYLITVMPVLLPSPLDGEGLGVRFSKLTTPSPPTLMQLGLQVNRPHRQEDSQVGVQERQHQQPFRIAEAVTGILPRQVRNFRHGHH
jgi:hypothetical protein